MVRILGLVMHPAAQPRRPSGTANEALDSGARSTNDTETGACGARLRCDRMIQPTSARSTTDMDTQRVALTVEGMTCDHCAAIVQRALAGVPGVEQAEVSLPDKRADILAKDAAPEALVRAIENVGYRASILEPPASETLPPPRARHTSSGRMPDIVVLGGGSAGFAASIRAADLGARVRLIEGGTLGGTCVNVGCVPSKTLIPAPEHRD
ncbi:MAG: FAD-dependent oxidoreductase [Luteitalea sp.]|nr:FAD-dependent oxidoreductase [Luteitalea sp.]